MHKLNWTPIFSQVAFVALIGLLSGCAFHSAKQQKVEATPAEPPAPTTKIVREQVALDATTLFAFDSAELTTEGKAAIDRVIEEAGTNPAGQITVVGHTDRIGPEDYNVGLSERRARAVAAYMIQKGVPEARISASGRGESEPLVQCQDQAWKALVECLSPNRRVVVNYPTIVEQEIIEQE